MVTGGGSVPAPAAIGGGAMAGSMVTSTATPTAADSAGVPPPRRTSENRRSNKPIMEKRRRARINNCLNELKTLILDAMKKDPARHSKLEKADILEMTVKHLENLQRQQAAMTAATDPTVLNKFRAGFSECATEVGRFPGLESPVRRRLLQHLANCLNGTVGSAQQPASKDAVPTTSPVTTTTATPPPSPPTQQLHTSSSTLQVHIVPSSSVESSHHQVNSSSTQAAPNGIFFATTSTGANGSATGLQLVPTRLPNGDIALVLPTTPTTAHFFRQVVPASSTSPATSPAPSSGSFSSASSSSSSPLPMLIPIPSRTSSNSSSSSSMSSAVSPVGFDRLSVRDAATSPKLLQYSSQPLSAGSSPHHMHHQHSQHSSQQYLHPNVESLSVEPPNVDPLSIDPLSLEGEGPYDMSIDRKPLMAPRSYSPPLQKPLALVIKKRPASDDIPEEKPWRPW